MLIVFRGLPGTGKSHLVRLLVAARQSLLVLDRDSIRAGLIAHPDFGVEEKALIDDLIIAMAGFLLGRGRHVVIDGMALSSESRLRELADMARTHGTACRIVECTCSERTALHRIAMDGSGHPAGDRSEKLYHEVKARYARVDLPCLSIDTENSAAGNIEAILDYIGMVDEPLLNP